MQNAHLRLGQLEYRKLAASNKSVSTHITVHLDRLILEPSPDPSRAPRCHLLSVFGGEQEIAALHAAVAEQASFRFSGPGVTASVASVGERAHSFRGWLQIPGCRQPVRHLVALSQELFETQAGGNALADRTILYSQEAEFLVYRLGVRFGLPLLPGWSGWIAAALASRGMIQKWPGIGCRPVLVQASKRVLLDLVADAVRAGLLQIPEEPTLDWKIPQSFGSR